MNNISPPHSIHHAVIKRRKRFSPVWIIPIFAVFIAMYLGWQTMQEEGPLITISFDAADGLVAGQTEIKYKAVPLGTVRSIVISKDHKHVIVKARMNREAKDIITDQTRFWVVRPRLSYGDISGFETLVSGAYIQCDPGAEEGKFETQFTGLEEPPGVTLNEPGTLFELKADKLGQINVGSPVYFRDVDVGQVLHYDVGDGFESIKISIFVRSPYDKFVHEKTSFWNTSGLSIHAGPTGLQVQLQSLQAVIEGGISFSTGSKWKDTSLAARNTLFRLYANSDEAEIAEMKHIAFISYFKNTVKGIGPGTPVSIYGIQVGEVTGTKLLIDKDTADVKVQVKFQIEPERLLASSENYDPLDIIKKLIAKGLQVKIDSALLLPSQNALSLEFMPEAKEKNMIMEDDAIVLPSAAAGSIDTTINNLADITRKIDQIPFGQIGDNLNSGLEGVNQQSDLQRSAKRTLDEVDDAARSLKLLTDFLSHHPEALIRGRSAKEGD